MEAATPPPAPADEPDPFADDAAPPADPAPLPEPPAADVPVEEPPPAEEPAPAAEPEDAEHVEPLPGEAAGEQREADAPAEPPQATGPGEEAQPAGTAAAEPDPEPAPADEGTKNRERDYTLMEKIGVGELLKKLGIDPSSLGQVADVLVYHPIHELRARNQETAISRTFAQDGPHGREYKGSVVTLPTSHLATKEVEVGVQTSVRVQIH